MNLGSKEDIVNFIENSGSTLTDIAANHNTTQEVVGREFKERDIPLPSMRYKGSFDYIKRLQRGILTGSGNAHDVIQDATGGVQHMPVGQNGELIPNIHLIYKAVHGEKFLDQYTGAEVDASRVYAVDGNSSNYLITNIEAVGEETWKARFDHPIGNVTEIFKIFTKYFEFDIEISRKYDQLVGGTYNPDYMLKICETWVGYPLNRYFHRLPEEEAIFTNSSPTYMGWWAWTQLSNYGLLKGLKSISVKAMKDGDVQIEKDSGFGVKMQHIAIIRDIDVLDSIKTLVVQSQAHAFKKKEETASQK